MQNIKTVVTAIGTDIGNLNRNYQSLQDAIAALQRNGASSSPDGVQNSPENSPLVQLRYTVQLPDALFSGNYEFERPSEFQIGLNVPGQYSGKPALHLESGKFIASLEDAYSFTSQAPAQGNEVQHNFIIFNNAPLAEGSAQGSFAAAATEALKSLSVQTMMASEINYLFEHLPDSIKQAAQAEGFDLKAHVGKPDFMEQVRRFDVDGELEMGRGVDFEPDYEELLADWKWRREAQGYEELKRLGGKEA